MITDVNGIIDDVDGLKADLQVIQNWIDNFDTSYIETVIEDLLLKMIIVGINDSGYIVYYIPESWDDITFNTTQLDIFIPDFTEYGHLVLSY